MLRPNSRDPSLVALCPHGLVNRAIKDANVEFFHYRSHDRFRVRLTDFSAACSFARRLKTLTGLTPAECTCETRASEPERLILNPTRRMLGIDTKSPRERRRTRPPPAG
jgi:hypothetical protein